MKILTHLFLLVLIIIYGCSGNSKVEQIKFNKEKWLKGDRELRGKMVDNIIYDSLLIGKSKLEVLNLLGTQRDTNQNFSYQVDIGYKAGPWFKKDVWLFNLNIHFDSLSKKVTYVNCND